MRSVGELFAGRFSIERVAGSGGMGTVYAARDLVTDRPVALKMLQMGGSTDADIERFLREASVLADLEHPGIVGYVSHGASPDGQRFLAMEWLSGEDLGKRLRRGPLSISETVSLLRQVASALALAHQRGVIHRDPIFPFFLTKNARCMGPGKSTRKAKGPPCDSPRAYAQRPPDIQVGTF